MAFSDQKSDHMLQSDNHGYPLRRTSLRLKRGAALPNKADRPEKKRKTVKHPVDSGRDCGSAIADSTAVQRTVAVERRAALPNKAATELSGRDCDSAMAADEMGVHVRVTKTLRNFNKHYLHFYQEEENRKEAGLIRATSKKQNGTNYSTKKPRPDLKAMTEMMRTGEILNAHKRLGSIAGIDVGHQFFSRAEMVVVGLHQHWLNGIDFIPASGKSGKAPDFKKYKLPLALSIVLSGQYEDDLDNCEDIVYTGQGGNDLLGNKRQIKNQLMKRGNLALKNSMEQSLHVRVVRGHKCPNSYAGKVYTYDGLYKVVKYWDAEGVSGFTVFKFRLTRIDGQPPLTTKEVFFTRGRIPQSISEIRRLVCEDISRGLEDIPIPVTNMVDDPPVSPPGFVYTTKMKFSKNTKPPSTSSVGCNCKDMCTDPRRCGCAKFNGGSFPYVHRDGGRLLEPKAVVFECGPLCGCGPNCVNRTSQHGLRFRLEVFRTPKMGWGVKSWDYIPSGAPICEYIGLLRRTQDLNRGDDNSYVLDIDCLQTMKGLEGRESRYRGVCLPSHLQKVCEEASETVPFCIDAVHTGNVSRFINHSCQPNLFIQCMLGEHHDIKLAKVMLIAADNIPPLKELTYDYGYPLNSVLGPDGEIQQMHCLCGADECRKRLY